MWDGREEIGDGSWFMNGKRIEQKGRGKKKENGRVEMRRWIVEGEDERDMREKEEWKNNKSICHTHLYCGKFVTLLLHVAKNIRFGTSDKLGFLVFGVSNVPNI